MSAEAATAIESQVRELIRKRGVDPVRDVETVRRLVDDALASWEQRALAGAVAPGPYTAAIAAVDPAIYAYAEPEGGPGVPGGVIGMFAVSDLTYHSSPTG